MKAKNSLRDMLWPLVSAIVKFKYRLFSSRKPQKTNRNPFNLDLEKVAADSKRIAEKMQATQLLAEQSKLQNKSPSDSAVGEQSNNDSKNGRVLCGWREDEDDRFSVKDYSFPSYRQNPYCDQHPEKLKAIIKALFLADHDAAQLEQYELENGGSQQVVIHRPALTLKQTIYRGLRVGLVLIIVLGGQSARVKAQTEIKALKIGDKVPDITIQNIINYSSTSTNISDFKGKLLILDFWATWCSPCVAMIPKTDSLQKVFAGKVQFMPITYQSKQEVEVLFKRLQKQSDGSHSKITTAVSDKNLRKLFPHVSLPHYVWIGGDGNVKAITGFEDVTSKNIAAAIAREDLKLEEKKEFRIPYDRAKPLLLNNNGGNGSNMIYRSLLTGYTDGLGSGISFNRNDPVKGRKITGKNQNIKKLYSLAYREDSIGSHYFGNNRIAMEVKDPSRLTNNSTGTTFVNWLKDGNGFCYELIVPPALGAQAFGIMRNELDKFFPQYKVTVEKRKTRCLALVRTSPKVKFKTAGGEPSVRVGAIECFLQNVTLASLINQLDRYYLQNSPLPIIDATGFSGNVDMHLNTTMSDVGGLNRELARYDLKFVEKDEIIDILVFRDALR